MGRALGPQHKLCRRFGVKLCDNFKCPVTKRNYAPGQHGQKRVRKKRSDYGNQLREKQKAKYIYGLLERQFHNTFKRASKLSGSAGTNLIKLLEKRFDNIVYRSGFATTKRLARQLVNHGHFEIDGKKVSIPSYSVRVGQVITVRANKAKTTYWKNLLENWKKVETPGWIKVDPKKLIISVVAEPKDEELPQNIETQLIVEFYSR